VFYTTLRNKEVLLKNFYFKKIYSNLSVKSLFLILSKLKYKKNEQQKIKYII